MISCQRGVASHRYSKESRFDKNAAMACGDIRSDLERRGLIIGGNDLFIAAHALSLNYTLVTKNQCEFERVRGLKIENWAVGEPEFK